MKKIFISFITLLCSIVVLAALTSCDQNSVNEEDNQSIVLQEGISEQQIASGETWLNSVFQCENSTGYCLPDQNKVFTGRYLEFYQDELTLFEYPDFETEGELLAAEKAYTKKWGNIYPLGEEVWTPFGMGSGMQAGDKLTNVSISRITDLKYRVLIHYSEGMVFANDVTLLQSGAAFLIDYINTKSVE